MSQLFKHGNHCDDREHLFGLYKSKEICTVLTDHCKESWLKRKKQKQKNSAFWTPLTILYV